MSTGKSARLSAVLDTNVYISAFTHRGVTSQLWRQAVEGRYTLFTSRAIILETARILRGKFKWAEPELINQLKLIARVAEIVAPEITLREVADDPDDDRILECAVACHADVIVSGDRHLLKLKSFRGIAVVTPTAFGRILGVAAPSGRRLRH